MNRQMKWGIVLQYSQMALSIIISFIYTPLMLRILGQSEYGLYNLASSIISYLSLLSLGFGAGYIRFYSRYKSNNDEDGIKKLNSLYLTVFLVLGLIALVAGLFLSFNVSILFNSTYTAQDIHIAKLLMIFLTVNLAISFPMSLFTSYVTSQEKFIFQKLLNIGKTVISPALCIVFLFFGYGSIGMVIVTTIISIVIDIINMVFCLSKLKMRFKFGKMDFPLLKEIFIFCLFIAINQIIDQINWQTDKVILGKMLNSSAVAIYAVGATINSMYINFSTAISSVFVPQVHRIVSDNKENMNNELSDLFIKVGRIQFFVVMLVLTGFIFFGKFFILKWAGEDYGIAYYIVLLLIAPVTISLIQNLGIEIQRAKNKHKFRSIVYLIMALLNIGISILFCSMWGIVGTAFGTTISLIIANFIIMNIYYHKVIGINIFKFWFEILKILPSLILPVAGGVCLMLFYNFNSLVDFVLFIGAYSLLYCLSVFAFGLKKAERQKLFGFLNFKNRKGLKNNDSN